MDKLHRIKSGIWALFFRGRLEAELDEELRHHIQLETEKNVRAGMSPKEARRKALVDFGGVERFRERTRAAWGVDHVDTIRQDLRFALRSLRRRPGLSALAVLTLAVGIGANTTVFPLLNVFLIKPLDFPESGRLYHVSGVDLSDGMPGAELSWAEFAGIRDAARTLEGVGAYTAPEGVVLRGTGEPLYLNGATVSADLFPLLGIRAALGRTFLPEDQEAGAPPVAVLSHGLWARAFGEDPQVLGSTVMVDGVPHTIVGVLGPGREFPEILDLWVPVRPFEGLDRHARAYDVVVRLNRGVDPPGALAELEGIVASLEAQRPPTGYSIRPRLQPLRRQFIVPEAMGSVAVMYLLVAIVLLVACFNVATLLLARGADRGEEMAVRAGLGAGRRRILQQLLVESALLAVLGAVPGVLLGLWGMRRVLGSVPIRFPGFIDFGLDPVSAGGLAAIVVAAGVVSGLWPALHATRTDLASLLRGRGGRDEAGTGPIRGRFALVVGQIALSVGVAVGAGVLLKGKVNLEAFEPGFEPDGLVGVFVDLDQAGIESGSNRARLLERLETRLARVPGVEAVSAGSRLPVIDQIQTRYFALGVPPPPEVYPEFTSSNFVQDDFFDVLGMTLLEGRRFNPDDAGPDAPPVALVDRAFVERHWPGENVLGKSFYHGSRPGGGEVEWVSVEVVGVVETARWIPPRRDPGTIFRPYRQDPTSGVTLVVMAAGDPEELVEMLRRGVREVAPALPIHWAETVPALIRQRTWTTDVFAGLFNLMAALAVLMAMVGVSGVVADAVARRTREFGIRMAVGASAEDVRRLAVSRGGRMLATGIGLGVLMGYFLALALRGLAYGVDPHNPTVYGLVVALAAAVFLAASYLPALRIGRLDPMRALRSD